MKNTIIGICFFVAGFASAIWYTEHCKKKVEIIQSEEVAFPNIELGANLEKGDTFYIIPNSINGVPTGPVEMYIKE